LIGTGKFKLDLDDKKFEFAQFLGGLIPLIGDYVEKGISGIDKIRKMLKTRRLKKRAVRIMDLGEEEDVMMMIREICLDFLLQNTEQLKSSI
jgi:hypothetical protein